MLTGVCYFQVVQSGGKNIELAVMRKGETLKVNQQQVSVVVFVNKHEGS